MTKLKVNLLIFSVPLLLLVLADLLLPYDFFTQRPWEAAVVMRPNAVLTGPFYPLIRIEKTEVGDLARYVPLGIPKKVIWETDRFGYRTRDSNKAPSIMLIGDSNIAGSALTQKETLAYILSERLRTRVYPLSPTSLDAYLGGNPFFRQSTRVVIVESIERDLITLPRPFYFHRNAPALEEGILAWFFSKLKANPWVIKIFIAIDRLFYKRTIFQFLRGTLARFFNYPNETKVTHIKYLEGDFAVRPIPDSELEKALETIEMYRDAVEDLGAKFIFLPIPNKENIYPEYLRRPQKPVFLRRLIKRLQEKNINVIDTQTSFDAIKENGGEILYHLDDSHWNANGVRAAADQLIPMIENLLSEMPSNQMSRPQ